MQGNPAPRREVYGDLTLAPMRQSFLTFGKPQIGEEEITEVVDSLRSGWIGTGPKVARFERMLEDYLGARHCRCVSSCTAALMLAMQAAQVRAGDEVLVPADDLRRDRQRGRTCEGTAGLRRTRSRGTGLIDLVAAEALITERTRAIIPVHLAGRPVDMDRLRDLRDRYGLVVIEDAAHAIGAEWRGRRIGAFGNPDGVLVLRDEEHLHDRRRGGGHRGLRTLPAVLSASPSTVSVSGRGSGSPTRAFVTMRSSGPDTSST